MCRVEVEKDGVIYTAEYFCEDNEISVIGNGTIEVIFINGMRETHAAKTGLRNLIRKGKAFTKDELE
ncbi:hypothetical protein G5645_01885 [Pectobacterium carotovorum]|uniref:hypothetical protein n=1 Tax=Pectobacterium carotovorum TaxID=554 RepID=UPI00191F9FFA|nr:hypothetical protein [Pectobacterium carotovorum]MBL0906737.1 hypothetical protein [Pectobacterium carotovorum]